MKYVKRNAVARRRFDSFAAFESHLACWLVDADHRIHGTTHERPADRFEKAERTALRPLPQQPLPARERRLPRRVSHDALVDVDTIRYSVPHALVRDRVEVFVGEREVTIFHGSQVVARHERSFEPFAIVRDPQHYAGLWRPPTTVEPEGAVGGGLAAMGRSLAEYAALVEGGAV